MKGRTNFQFLVLTVVVVKAGNSRPFKDDWELEYLVVEDRQELNGMRAVFEVHTIKRHIAPVCVMGELSSVVGGAYSSARQASVCPRTLAPGRGQPHPNLAPKLMTTCNPDNDLGFYATPNWDGHRTEIDIDIEFQDANRCVTRCRLLKPEKNKSSVADGDNGCRRDVSRLV